MAQTESNDSTSFSTQPPSRPEGPTGGAGYPGGGYLVGPVDDGQPHLADYVRILAKRRGVVLATFLAVAVPGAILSLTGPPFYQARARIVVDQEMPELSAIRSGAGQQQNDEIETHAQVLRSRAVARRAVAELKLWQNPSFEADNRAFFLDPRPLAGRMTAAVRGLFSSRGSAQNEGDGRAPAGNPADQPGLVDAFLARLAVEPVPLSRLIDIRYTSGDPRLCAAAVNTLARVYLEQDLEDRFQSAKVAANWLDQQLAEQRKRVEDSQAKLQSYRERHNALSLDDRQQNVVAQKLAELNSAVTRAKTERIGKEEAYNQLQAIENDKGALDTFPAILSNAFIQQLKSQLAGLQQERSQLSERFGEKHPEMVRVNSAIQVTEARLQGEIAKVVQSVRNEYLAARANERSLVTAYEQQKREALDLSRKGIDDAALQREAQSNQQIYDTLLQQAKQAGMAGEIRRGTIRLVDPADEPSEPVGPNRTQNLLIALFGGGLLAIGLAFALDYLGNRIDSPEEIKLHLRVPFFGLVPAVVGRKSGAGRPLISENQSASFREAFRRVRTNVMLGMPPGRSRSLVVTSTGPREGKTVVTANLAVALAKAGQSVLLVDADMRKPRINELFGKQLEPGLTNVLAEQASAADAIRETTTPNLQVMPAGSEKDSPAELLSSPRFKALMASLREGFQWIIIDAPPVLAVTDATLLANEVGNVLFVVGSEMTTRGAAKTAIEELQRAQAQVVGSVLNKVNLERDGYYYSRYYKPEYEAYYLKSKKAQRSGGSILSRNG